MDSQKIVIPLPDGFKLVAERGSDRDYYEIFVGIVREDDVWWQDLAVVRNAYHYEKGTLITDKDKYEVLVYGDENNEDYTDLFKIDLYHGGE